MQPISSFLLLKFSAFLLPSKKKDARTSNSRSPRWCWWMWGRNTATISCRTW